MYEVREFAGHADIRTTEGYSIRKEEDAEVAAAAHPDPPHGAQGRVNPAATVPEIRAAEWAGDEWNGRIRWMAKYTMPMTVQPGEAVAKGLASERV